MGNSIINNIKKTSDLSNAQKIVICKDVYRIITSKVSSSKFNRFCPSIDGAISAFNASRKNLTKLYRAAFKIFGIQKYQKLPFTPEPFKKEFPNNPEISDQKWLHTYRAIYEIIISYNFDRHVEWDKNIPFLLSYVGAYQGWLDPARAVPREIFQDGLNDRIHQPFVTDLYDQLRMVEQPVVPAMNFRSNLNGLNTPSVDGGMTSLPTMEFAARSKWTLEEKRNAMVSKNYLLKLSQIV